VKSKPTSSAQLFESEVDRILGTARSAWQANVDRDDRVTRRSSERRLADVMRVAAPARSRRDGLALSALAAACVCLGLALLRPTSSALTPSPGDIHPEPTGAGPLAVVPLVAEPPSTGVDTAEASGSTAAAPAPTNPTPSPAPASTDKVPEPRPTASAVLPPLPPPSSAVRTFDRGDPWGPPRKIGGARKDRADPWGALARAPQAESDRSALQAAELELGRGELVAARDRLRGLVTRAEPAIAFAAASTLARSYSEPRQQLAVWEDALRRAPPGPHRARIEKERRRVLVLIVPSRPD
jgi:hypothetical protein